MTLVKIALVPFAGILKMHHNPSTEDHEFMQRFESSLFPVDKFDHRAHVPLAFVYPCNFDATSAYQKMRNALFGFMSHHVVDPSKYHETITKAWVLAVQHFMQQTPATYSASEFISANPMLLDTEIMMSHYTKDVLFSDEARTSFVEPNIEPIPRYGNGTP